MTTNICPDMTTWEYDALKESIRRWRVILPVVKDERAREALKILGDDAPRKDWDLRLAEQRARRAKREQVTGTLALPITDDQVRLHHCPFQELEQVAGIEPNSVSLVLTDIPYDRDFLPQVADLGAFAARVLVDGGLLVTYSGQYHLDRVMQALGEHLTYRWMRSSEIVDDANLVHPLEILSFWKPVLLYSKGAWRERPQWHDRSRYPHKEKEWHPQQQPLAEVEQLVRDFSMPGDLVVDPCGGGFTTAVACRNFGRRCVSCDVEERWVIGGQRRLAGETAVMAG